MATYKVKKTDNYPKIAEQFKIPTQQLIKANQSVPLSAGQAIKIPKIPPLPLEKIGNAFGQIGNAIGSAWTGYTNAFNASVNAIDASLSRPSFGGGGFNPPNYQQVIPAQPNSANIQSAYMSQFPSQGTIGTTGLQTAYMNKFPSQGTIGTTGLQTAYMNKFPSQGTVAGNTAPMQSGTGKPKPPQNTFPGFWGGGKNGTFYTTLRGARQATKRLNQQKAAGDEPVYSQQVYTPPAVVKPAVTSGRDETVTWSVG